MRCQSYAPEDPSIPNATNLTNYRTCAIVHHSIPTRLGRTHHRALLDPYMSTLRTGEDIHINVLIMMILTYPKYSLYIIIHRLKPLQCALLSQHARTTHSQRPQYEIQFNRPCTPLTARVHVAPHPTFSATFPPFFRRTLPSR